MRKEKKLIHQYKNNGYNVVLDVNSGSVHIVDDIVYDVISYMVENGLEHADKVVAFETLNKKFADRTDALSELVDEIYTLREDGMLLQKIFMRKALMPFKIVRRW